MEQVSPLFIVIGLVLGLVFAVTTVSGAVWSVQITLSRGIWKGLSVGIALSLAQAFWAGIGSLLVFWLGRVASLTYLEWIVRAFASMILLHMGMTLFQARKKESLQYKGKLKSMPELFWHTLITAFAMPMRFPGYIALFISASLHLRGYPYGNSVLIAIGACIGSYCWWLYLILLAAIFGHRVPEPITLRSINKLKILAASIFWVLFAICALPLFRPLIQY